MNLYLTILFLKQIKEFDQKYTNAIFSERKKFQYRQGSLAVELLVFQTFICYTSCMDKQKYIDTHPGYVELSVPEYSLHKLRLLTPDIAYAKESLDWVSDNEVGKYVGADFSDVSLEGEKDRLKEILGNIDGYNWIIECDGTVIGNINISDIKDTSNEFGVKAGCLNYIIGEKNMWGKGITSALVKVVLLWAFSKNGYEIIKSRVVPQK